MSQLDAVIIAATTSAHYEVAKFFLQQRLHCFIEKPIATTLKKAAELVLVPQNVGRVIQVGYVERFNSAVTAVSSFVSSQQFIELDRIAPYQLRATDVGVILDLMIHDIDLISALFNICFI
jgi:predicted dehydrogenase